MLLFAMLVVILIVVVLACRLARRPMASEYEFLEQYEAGQSREAN